MHTSTAPTALFESHLPALNLLHRGKVRDLYALDEKHLLMVATDRLSAFDVILPSPIPGKGRLLTAVSNFWFKRLAHIVPNHVQGITTTLDRWLDAEGCTQIEGRSMISRRCQPLPVEAIVRGYLIGSGWRDYCREGTVCGLALPKGLQMADQLPEPVFTPSTKAAVGDHDRNVSFEAVCDAIGRELAERVREISLQLYREAAAYARERGILIADTKFEFGLDDDGQLILIDEALTPDSSRFWPLDAWQPGVNPPSFDKQIVRDYLDTLDWDKTPPGPVLPEAVLLQTLERYREVVTKLNFNHK